MIRFVFIAGLLCSAVTSFAYAQNFNEFAIPTLASSPSSAVRGPDGRVWFTESSQSANKIAAIASDGTITEFPLLTPNAGALGIAVGTDNQIWLALATANKVARISTQGNITEFLMPTANSEPRGIASGPDGNIWVTLNAANKIARVTTAGEVTEFAIPTANAFPEEIVAGSDGAMWFASSGTNSIGRVTTSGTFSNFPLPTADSLPQALAAGADGNVWFTELVGNRIGRISPAGIITEFEIPTAVSFPYDITRGPDGLLWFVQALGNKLASIRSDGQILEYALPRAGTLAVGVATTANGDVWFVGSTSNAVGRMTTAAPGLHFGPIFTSAQPASRSFIRLYNTANATGSAIVQLSNATTGAIVGQWTVASVPAGAAMQFDVAEIEKSLGLSGALPQFYSLTVTGQLTGFAQHVLWRSADGTLTNLSSCHSGNASIRTQLIGVHSSLLAAGYPSSVAVNNPSSAAFSATLGVYDARNGAKLGTFTTTQIPSRGQTVVPVSTIESSLGVSPSDAMFHYVIKAEGRFPGFLQHFVTNQQSGVVTDMSAMCALIPGS